ncbi:MAG: TraB/GumN family protein [Ferruginibacter sp.]|nr:TraB/GumN family protein [Ferruginibacter sp.]
MNLLKILGAMFFFCSCNAQSKQVSLKVNADDNSLLWEISGRGLKNSSYLFGTFHLMCKNDIRFSEQLKTAVSNSGVVYLEMDMDDPAILLGGLLMMNMKDGKKLKDLYNADEYQKLIAYFKDTLHMPVGMLQSTKPFFLAALLYPKMMPCKTVSGVEEELMKLAKQQKKEIKGLETMEFQAAVFDSIPYEEQAKELLKSIDSMVSYQKYFDTMIAVYKTQRLMEIEKLFKDSEFGMEDHQDLLLNDRNKNWVAQLKTIMKGQSVFIAVGAGHLVGKEGLISLLRKEGYTLKPILNK